MTAAIIVDQLEVRALRPAEAPRIACSELRVLPRRVLDLFAHRRVTEERKPSYTFARALLKIDGSTASTGRSHLIQEPGKLGYAARTACPRVLPAFA